jgi:nucleoside-diphosphate-sugar epimerase
VTIVPPEILDRIRSTYAGKNVLVTGGASFISSHLVEALVEVGARVRVVDDLSSGTLDNLAHVHDDVETLIGDVRDGDVATKASRDQEVVFHLAAAHGGRGYIDTHPVECLNNMSLDHTVFSAAVNAGASKIVHASSACVYPTNLQDSSEDRQQLAEISAGFDEPGQAFADGAYGWSKLMGEFQLASFVGQFGVDGISCRIFTAYGERENESHAVIALIAKAVARLDPYPIWGSGKQTRNFTYVADTVTGLLLSGQAVRGFDVVNVGTSSHHSIDELMEVIFERLDWHPAAIDRQLEMPVGVLSRAADCTKSQALLGWEPATPLQVGIARTVDWYRSVASKERLDSLDSLLMSR